MWDAKWDAIAWDAIRRPLCAYSVWRDMLVAHPQSQIDTPKSHFDRVMTRDCKNGQLVPFFKQYMLLNIEKIVVTVS